MGGEDGEQPLDEDDGGDRGGDELERVLRQIMSQQGVGGGFDHAHRVGLDEQFVELGVDSLQATELRCEIEDVLDLEDPLPTELLEEHDTLRKLIEHLRVVLGSR
jgi:acyl carrier protein